MCDFCAKNIAKRSGKDYTQFSYYPDFSTKPPRYCLLVEPKEAVAEEERQQMIEIMDEEFCEVNEKYFKYRRWGMLNRPEILILKPKTYWDYREMLRAKGVVLNQIKPVTVINSQERKDFFFSHVETENSSTIDEWKANKE
jgi:hypothetical protein